jgi:hypothetical protein
VRLPASLLAPTLLVCAFAPAGAQLRASVDVAGGELGFGIVPASVFVVAGTMDFRRGWLEATANASTFTFDHSKESTFATGSITLRPPRREGVSGELLTIASTTNHHGFYKATRFEGRVGARLIRGPGEGAIRYGLAALTHDGEDLTANLVEVEASRAFGWAVVTLAGAHNRFTDRVAVVRDTTYMVAGFPFRGRHRTDASVRRNYIDAEARVDWRFRSATLGLALGARRGDASTSKEQWERVDISFPLNPQVAVIASGGRKPAIPEERLPSGAFATLGVQVTWQNEPRRPPFLPVDGRDTPRLVSLDVGGGRRSINIIGLAARRVEIMGDFTDWEALELAPIGNRVWYITMPIAPGAHHVSIRVDGGPWMPPPGLPVTADEFMGTVGILLIE